MVISRRMTSCGPIETHDPGVERNMMLDPGSARFEVASEENPHPPTSTAPQGAPPSFEPHAASSESPDAPAQPPNDDPPPEGRVHGPYADPVDGLLRTAAVSRPLDAVTRLVTLLEQSPDGARVALEALRVAAVDRPVEEVAELVSLLAGLPQHAISADEAISTAAEHRPVEDVSRLMALLHRPPHVAHTGEQAVRAAATSRSVEDLVELIARLEEERDTTASAPSTAVAGPEGREERGNGVPFRWLRWSAALSLLLCGLVHFPFGAAPSALMYGLSAGAILCALLAVLLCVRSSLPTLIAGVLVPGALAAVHLLGGILHAPALPRAVESTSAPSVLATVAALLAASICGAALAISLRDRPGVRPDRRTVKDAGYTVG